MKPTKCPEHRGRNSYTAGCPGCQTFTRERYRIRSRSRAYGTWVGYVDPAPAQQRVVELVRGGATFRQIGRAAQVDHATVADLYSNRLARIRHTTSVAILAVAAPPPDYLVPSFGVARRLQSLTRAGYRIRDLHPLLPGRTLHTLRAWRVPSRRWVTRTGHDQVDALYQQLWDHDGPHPDATALAVERGWAPLEAWTPDTIDDPEADPYSSREAAGFVDWVKLDLARLPAGAAARVRFVDLTDAEKLALYTQHIDQGGSPRGFRDRYRPVPIADLRVLQQLYGSRV